ncbi:hypothetical protein Poli38472_013428 [Pythium oligandrum]|uniref:Uncharacterized protein n=1 Tax=Pythium oligandrum TaxID=41045 RepID=A0A8K1C7C0_PYTOL|nr:hypothetical protein Poli38472_013428 [Pythium oligandrum]|eukprot:TMW57954.1 hypothetical protein Poli38472_013428 [Pythium oligandrum]
MALSKRPHDANDGGERVEDENAQNRLENVVSHGDVHVLKRLHREFATALTQQDGDRAMRQAVRQAVMKHL